MDALATHAIWTPALRALGWMSAAEERAVADLFAVAHSDRVVSVPSCYVFLKGSLETLQRHTRQRGRSFETGSDAFGRLLAAVQASAETFAAALPPPHVLVVDVDRTPVRSAAMEPFLADVAARLGAAPGRANHLRPQTAGGR
jgi:deoxyadenosine/deoxycytidine kinase